MQVNKRHKEHKRNRSQQIIKQEETRAIFSDQKHYSHKLANQHLLQFTCAAYRSAEYRE